VLPLGGASAVVVLYGGTVYRTDDGAETWAAVGRATQITVDTHVTSAALGPDGRLYVGILEQGPNGRGWVWRTAEVLTASVGVSAEPVDPPVVIGPGGGSFLFRVRLTNTTTLPQTVEAWSEVSGPLALSPVIGPRSVTLPPGASVTRTLVQRVPGAAPAGTYTYTVAVGDFPGGVVSSDGFTVVKQGAEGTGGGDEGWAVSGWDEAASAAEPEGGAWGLAVSPNPFRGEAAVTLTLTEPAEVTVALYDGLGRRVALLHEGALGAGSHALPLPAALPPGVYAVRAIAGGAVAARTVTRLR
jgi:hypothetical protein